jgi:D-amino-acid dehydrogenase
METARLIRPLFALAVAEHEALLAEAGALRYLRKEGWLKLYRGDRSFGALKGELALAQEFGISYRALDTEAARALEPSLAPVFRHAVHWQGVASVTNPLAVTQAYAARFAALGGVGVRGDARSLHRADGRWRVETTEGPLDAAQAVVALGPFAPDLLAPLGIVKLPLGLKRGLPPALSDDRQRRAPRPVVDNDIGYRLHRWSRASGSRPEWNCPPRRPPTPVQFDRLLRQPGSTRWGVGRDDGWAAGPAGPAW